MSPIDPPSPSPYPEGGNDVLAPLPSEEEDETELLYESSVLVFLPVGSSKELVERVSAAVNDALRPDDPPALVFAALDDEPGESRRAIWAPIVGEVAKEVIKHIAKEAAHQQKMDHEAHEAHMRDVEAELERAREWRKKTYG